MLERLLTHKTLCVAPREELLWLVRHGRLRRLAKGDVGLAQGSDSAGMGMWAILSGRMAIFVDRGAGPKRLMDWGPGEVTGSLPFSRVTIAIGTAMAVEDTEIFHVDREHFPDLIRDCPDLTAIFVHVMLDRARSFVSSDLHDEKMISLGKLAAGLAHELNNPASAAVRSATLLQQSHTDAVTAAQQLGQAQLTSSQRATLERFRAGCESAALGTGESPIDRSDREDTLSDWLQGHDADASAASSLADAGVTPAALDDLAANLAGAPLDAAIRWMAAERSTRTLMADLRTAASRIYELVNAVKRFTAMDRVAALESVDVAAGLADTVAVMHAKALANECELRLEVHPEVPAVRGVGGELNQIWSSLIDNALDAAPRGHVIVTAEVEPKMVLVRIVDDGPGIPPDHIERIFDPFFTTKPVGQATGLGLSISRSLARRYSGDITVESRPTHTEFRVRLPIPRAD